MTRRCAFLAALLGIAQLSLPAVAASLRAQLTQVERLLDQWRIDDAAKALAPLVRSAPKHPLVLQLQGEVLFQRGEYKRAHELLREAVRHNRASLPLKGLRDLVGSTQEVVKGFVKHRSPSGEFEIWTARGKDEILVTFASETLERMRAALSQDLGYAPPGPIRVEILPSPDDLARVSPLSLADIDRSGTIALCKYNRLMIVTPRALLRGYGWRDALAHEYAHLAISRLSHNSVPIWLHEGLAKYLETRWRVPPGEAPPLSPAQEHLLAVALRKNRLIRWEQMHPSLAKLPSQEATMLAFAQVQTAVEFLVQRLRLAELALPTNALVQTLPVEALERQEVLARRGGGDRAEIGDVRPVPPAPADVGIQVHDLAAADIDRDPHRSGLAPALPIGRAAPRAHVDVVPVTAHPRPCGEAHPHLAVACASDLVGDRLPPRRRGRHDCGGEEHDDGADGWCRRHCPMISSRKSATRWSLVCPSQNSAFFCSSVSVSVRAIVIR